jgi:hypothetical protein
LISPKYNTTSLWNETYFGVGLEPMGQSSFVYLGLHTYAYEFTLGKLTSEHESIWTLTPMNESSGYYGIPIAEVVDSNVFILSNNMTSETLEMLLMKIDASGQELWRTSISNTGYHIPMHIDVASSGSIHVLSLSLNIEYTLPIEGMRLSYTLTRLDSQGNKLWNKSLLNQTYEDYILSFYNSEYSMGLGAYGEGVFLSIPSSVLRYDSSGNELWNITHDHVAFCPDPYGGFYTCERMLNDDFQISKWGTEGSIRWSQSLSLDYGLGWRDFPLVGRMEVGPDQLLYVQLEYRNVNQAITIARLSRTGQLHSHDTIFNLDDAESYGSSYRGPFITDIAVTGDGLVHLSVINDSIYSDEYPYIPYSLHPANTLLTYELSGPFIFRMSPESLIVSGVATLIFGGIAWDHFVRGRTRPEETLPEQEEIDPWELLMGDTEDK